jgi:hypothetical protein
MVYSGPSNFPAHLYDLDNNDPNVAKTNFQNLSDTFGTKEFPRVFGPLVIDLAGTQLVTAADNTMFKQDWVKIIGPGSITSTLGSGDLFFFTNLDGPGGLNNCSISDIGMNLGSKGRAAVRCYQTPFFTVERCTVENAASDTLVFEGCVAPIIDKAWVREARGAAATAAGASGLVLASIPQGETQRAAVTNFRCYDYAGHGIRIQEGVGHAINCFDLESCAQTGIQLSSSLGNVILGGYTEYNGPGGAGPDIQFLEKNTYIAERYTQYNLTGYCYLTSKIGVQILGNANTQYNYFDMMVLSGDFTISKDVLGTTLGSCMFVNGNLVDEGNDTVKLFSNANSPEMYWKRGRGKRLSVTVGVRDGGYVDYTSDIGLRFQNVASLSAGPTARKNLAMSVDLAGGSSVFDIRFAVPEPDTNYAVHLTPFLNGGTLPPGFLPHVIDKRTDGIRVGTSVAMSGTTVKLDILIVGLR